MVFDKVYIDLCQVKRQLDGFRQGLAEVHSISE